MSVMSNADLSMMEWHDRHISPRLSAIECHAFWVKHHAQELLARPGFETRAEGEIEETLAVLEAALSKVTAARFELLNKTQERSDAA